jgi:hypothetical protein
MIMLFLSDSLTTKSKFLGNSGVKIELLHVKAGFDPIASNSGAEGFKMDQIIIPKTGCT